MNRTRWAESFLNYRFEDAALLEQALTHRSASGINNERLEFLGDAFLGLIVADELYTRRGSDAEGDLSRARASLVNKEALSDLARDLQIDTQLVLGAGEARSGGAQRASIIADAFEAVIGAVYLDGGYEQARKLILHLFSDLIDNLPEAASLKDSKTRLQEWLQGRSLSLPAYRIESTSGADHHRQFTVICELGDSGTMTTGSGRSKRLAEQEAARAMLEELNIE